MSREVLLLCDCRHGGAKTIDSHIDGLVRHSRHELHVANMLGDIPPRLALERFDVVLVHYTLMANHRAYLSPSARTRLAAYPGLKAVFVQDEYRWVNSTVELLQQIGVHALFTCVPPEEMEKVYPEDKLPSVVKINTLTGYVDASLVERPVPPLSDRPVDVGYRARDLPAWLGELGQEKVRIGRRFAEDARGQGLRTDISYREEDRLIGDEWVRFLTRCRAVLGVESGASVFDFTGEIMRNVERAVRREPHLSFDELQRRYFGEAEGQIRLNQISPRCFEAAALRTLMILYEGDYSHRLVPWRHYVPLRKDHGNMAEVLEVLRNTDRAQEIVDLAYREVALNPINSYEALAGVLDDALDECLKKASWRPVRAYSEDELEHDLAPSWRERSLRTGRSAFKFMHGLILGKVLGILPDKMRNTVRNRLRRIYLGVTGKFNRYY